MPNQQRNNAIYRNLAVCLFIIALASNLAFAHGGEKHVMGHVTAIAANSITVETTSHEIQNVQITSQTKFVKGGKPASVSELKVGDRVVIHAKPSGEKLQATEVTFASAAAK
jgi:hypothetical protein